MEMRVAQLQFYEFHTNILNARKYMSTININ